MGFYPGFRAGRKVPTIIVGLVATYAINIARILIIVGMIAALGTSWVFIAHAVVGRVFFFIGIVIVYWYLDDPSDRLGGRREALARRRDGGAPWVASGPSSCSGACG